MPMFRLPHLDKVLIMSISLPCHPILVTCPISHILHLHMTTGHKCPSHLHAKSIPSHCPEIRSLMSMQTVRALTHQKVSTCINMKPQCIPKTGLSLIIPIHQTQKVMPRRQSHHPAPDIITPSQKGAPLVHTLGIPPCMIQILHLVKIL